MKKVTFKFATNYNQGTPNNGFSEELSHEIFLMMIMILVTG
jgi:hypothetical protein